MSNSEQALPLAGVKVVEFSTMITASLAAMMFAQQGAEVIKVEPSGIGDPMRRLGTRKNQISGLFHNCNKGKRSIVMDLKSPDEVALARKLCLDADIIIHNFRPGVMSRLGLDSESLMKEKPSLIYCAITGFGRQGPMSKRPAYDHVMQAMAGFMTTQGAPDGVTYVRTLLCDKITSYTAAQAVTAALYKRERTGEGSRLDISMLSSCIAFLWPDGAMHLTLMDEDDVTHAPGISRNYGLPMRTSDGAIAYAALRSEDWYAIFDMVGKPEFRDDPKYRDTKGRSENMLELTQIISTAASHMTTDEVMKALTEHDVPAAPCLSMEQMHEDEQIVAIGALTEEEHPVMGKVRSPKAPAWFNGAQLPDPRPCPALDEHGEDIRAEIAAMGS